MLARKGVSTGDLTGILSIPVATAQCHNYLRKNFVELVIRAANSTAEAAQLVSANSTEKLAAIAPKNAAKVYGLEVIATDIADHQGNQTRFVLVGKDYVTSATGHDKTAIVVFQRADDPGSLISILQEFAARR
ncbi:MAG: prephenate dehydratase, partial [Acidimicrobiaceae bacterium]